ncbi:MAG: DUF1214 domain-containing protein, partial [Rhodoferax sp.]
WLHSELQVGAWKANLHAGSADAGLYTRASVALNALLALGRDETMYFIATHDDAGQPLRSQCSYLVSGLPPPARWWSITAYAEDMFLFDAPSRRYSVNGSSAILDAQGRFSLSTGPQAPAEGAWLETPGARPLVLTLRLYNPLAALQAAPETLPAPRIRAVRGCT